MKSMTTAHGFQRQQDGVRHVFYIGEVHPIIAPLPNWRPARAAASGRNQCLVAGTEDRF